MVTDVSGMQVVYKILYCEQIRGRAPNGPAGTLPIIRLGDCRLRVIP